MPKMKTHKGLAKRIKITATGKVKHHKPGRRHLMSVKSGNRKRSLRKTVIVSLPAFAKRYRRLLGVEGQRPKVRNPKEQAGEQATEQSSVESSKKSNP